MNPKWNFPSVANFQEPVKDSGNLKRDDLQYLNLFYLTQTRNESRRKEYSTEKRFPLRFIFHMTHINFASSSSLSFSIKHRHYT